MIRIVKYENRRLYNPEESRYITLGDVLELVNQSKEFTVTHRKTKVDCTREVLFDVLKAREMDKPKLSAAQLAQLIRG